LRAWVPDSAPGFSGISGLRASPNTGGSPSAANSVTESPRLDYQMSFANTGSHVIWLRMNATRNADDRVFVGINDALPGAAGTAVDVPTGIIWRWVKGPTINVATVGTKFLSVWMGDDGVRVDAIVVSRETSTTPPSDTPQSNGNTWAYATNPDTASNTTCNADPFDTGPAPGDQDDNLPTGQMTSCFANGPGVNDAFDMSGNIREWVAPRLPGANPIRGGAANATVQGTTCALAFTLADDSFFFPNVGFRCCRAIP
jgi:hypothetical protein